MTTNSYIPAFNYHFLTPFYDAILNIIGFGNSHKEKIVQLLNLKRNERLLDVGCGTGSLLIVAKKLHPDIIAEGTDIDNKVLSIAKEKVEQEGLDIKLTQANAAKLPYRNASFEVVVSSLAFHHLPLGIKRDAMKEVKRILKPHGQFLLVDFGQADKLWMKIFFALLKLLHVREAETVKDNFQGKIPVLLEDVGFAPKEISPKHTGIQYWLSQKTT